MTNNVVIRGNMRYNKRDDDKIKSNRECMIQTKKYNDILARNNTRVFKYIQNLAKTIPQKTAQKKGFITKIPFLDAKG